MISKIILLFFVSVVICTASAVKLPADTMQKLELFSKKTLSEKTDLEEVKKNIEVLLMLDEEDPSRTAVHMLSKSYSENPALYERAIKTVKNKKNSKKLSEIRTILKNHYKQGNG